MKPKHLAEEGKVRLLLLKPGCHQRVTLVGSCYKVPSKRSMSKQEMDISKAKRSSDWYDCFPRRAKLLRAGRDRGSHTTAVATAMPRKTDIECPIDFYPDLHLL